MPDVPERCPLCGSETLYTGINLYHACGTRSTPGGEVVMEGWECAVRQRDAARAEVEEWKQRALSAEEELDSETTWRCVGCGKPITRDPGYGLCYPCRSELPQSRAEAERWKRRHDALQAAIIKTDALIVDAINHANAMYNYTQDAYYESYSDGLDEALTILRQLLDEAGGGKA